MQDSNATGSSTLLGISSMATRKVLAELANSYQASSGVLVQIESLGGVDAQKRVASGEHFDLVFLASNAIDKLIASGHVMTGSRVDLMRSLVWGAVPAGAPHPDLTSALALRQALLGAQSIAYSTGPSGVALAELFQAWGIAEQLAPRITVAPAGTPVASLLASSAVQLGFQQRSELLDASGIELVGPLPKDCQIETVFSAGICCTCKQKQAASAFLDHLSGPQALGALHRQGMDSM